MAHILQARRLQKAHMIREDFDQTARMRHTSLCRALPQMYAAFCRLAEYSQQAHDDNTTSPRRNVMTLHRR